MLYRKYLSSAVVWLQNAFCWNDSPWTSSGSKIRLHLSDSKTLNCFSLVLVSWGGEQGARGSVGWTPFPVTRLDVAVLFWDLMSITFTEVIRLCQLVSNPFWPCVDYFAHRSLASGMICSLSIFERFMFIFGVKRVGYFLLCALWFLFSFFCFILSWSFAIQAFIPPALCQLDFELPNRSANSLLLVLFMGDSQLEMTVCIEISSSKIKIVTDSYTVFLK